MNLSDAASKITITRNAEQVLNVVSKFEFDRYMIFGENMAAFTTRPKSIFWKTPTIMGAIYVLFALSGHASKL